MRIAAIIVAAGRGSRAPGDIPKQYRDLAGQPVISRTIGQFAHYDDIVCVINPDDQPIFKAATEGMDVTHTFGGATRTVSVRAGLEALKTINPDIVLIHDAARPFVSDAVIKDVITGLDAAQAAAPSLPIVDAVKNLSGGGVDRDVLRRVQTPQGFHFASIVKAYAAIDDSQSFADDVDVAHKAGLTIAMTQGDPENIKLTYVHDFEKAEARMNKTITVTGSGFDVHRLIAGDGMYLCGVKIDGTLSLLGHSDADVGLHALTDAILGAVSLGDIGDHFPPDDPQWKGAASDMFLAHAVKLAGEQNAELVHVDVTLICEKPKIKPHREAMRRRVSEIVGLPLARVSIKATTSEGLGFTGRAEGIAAQAVASVSIKS